MSFGLCNLSIIPCRKEASDVSEMVTQLLFGEHYQILERKDKWTRIKIIHDGYECWIDNKQVFTINDDELDNLDLSSQHYSLKPISTLVSSNGLSHYIYAGTVFSSTENDAFIIGGGKYSFDGSLSNGAFQNVETIAKSFLNAPYLWGGRTIAGIDCSGFSQLVFRLAGLDIHRDASQQAKQGELISGLSESAIGDLAFFDNQEGRITHVGIVLFDKIDEKKLIIHASGKVRIDNLDERGIYNEETEGYTHNLCLIKRYTNI